MSCKLSYTVVAELQQPTYNLPTLTDPVPYWIFTIEKKRTRFKLSVKLMTSPGRPIVFLKKTVNKSHVFLVSDDRSIYFHFEEMRRGRWMWLAREGGGEIFPEWYLIVHGQAFLEVLKGLPT